MVENDEEEVNFQGFDRTTRLKSTAVALQEVFDGDGFVLFVFELNAPKGKGQAGYVSNSHRGDVVKALKEFITILELDSHQGTKQ